MGLIDDQRVITPAAHPCHRAAALTPPECSAASASLRRSMLPSPHEGRLGLWSKTVSRPVVRSLSLRPDDSLTIHKMALSIGFQELASLFVTIQATGLWLLPW